MIHHTITIPTPTNPGTQMLGLHLQGDLLGGMRLATQFHRLPCPARAPFESRLEFSKPLANPSITLKHIQTLWPLAERDVAHNGETAETPPDGNFGVR
jgi:hypothetical protein